MQGLKIGLPSSRGPDVLERPERRRPIKNCCSSLDVILSLGWLATLVAWLAIEIQGYPRSLFVIFLQSMCVVLPLIILTVKKRWLSYKFMALAWPLAGTGVLSFFMAEGLYGDKESAWARVDVVSIWAMVDYSLIFIIVKKRVRILAAACMYSCLLAISLPEIISRPASGNSAVLIQLHLASAAMILSMCFFSRYHRQLQLSRYTHEELATLANTDSLTELSNRRHVAEKLNSELLRFNRYGEIFSVIVFDVDHFKKINDQYGHRVGDQTLVAIAERARGQLREVDTLGRWGGEEFLILLPQTDYMGVLKKAVTMCEEFSDTPIINQLFISVSCGVTTVSHGDSMETLLDRADKALYIAKENGRNRAIGLEASEVQESVLGHAK